MDWSEKTLRRLLGRVRHETLACNNGSPSDFEIGQQQLVDMAQCHIPMLVEALREQQATSAALATKLAAAEAQATELLARATRAEHERDQWLQEASAHDKRAAVLDGHGVAPYCDGKCGICHCEPFNL